MLEKIKNMLSLSDNRNKASVVSDEEPEITFLDTPTEEKVESLVSRILKTKIFSKNQSKLGEELIDQIKAELECLEYVNNIIKENMGFWLKEFGAHPLPGIKECPGIVYLNRFGGENKAVILSILEVIKKKNLSLPTEIEKYTKKVFCEFEELCKSCLNERACAFSRQPVTLALEVEKDINDLHFELRSTKRLLQEFQRWENNIKLIAKNIDALETYIQRRKPSNEENAFHLKRYIEWNKKSYNEICEKFLDAKHELLKNESESIYSHQKLPLNLSIRKKEGINATKSQIRNKLSH